MTLNSYFCRIALRRNSLLVASLATLFAITSCAVPSTTELSGNVSADAQLSLEDKAVKAWLYFYPLLLTQTKLLAEEPLTVNTWDHSENSFSKIYGRKIDPNADTIYSHAWLDLRKGPINLHLPNLAGRYYVIQAIDQWSQTFSAVGSRTIGGKADTVVYLPPGMQKEQYPSGHWPIGAIFVEAPSNTVLLLAQLQRGGPDEAQQISALQSQFILRRHAETLLSNAADSNETAVAAPDALLERLAAGVSPATALQELEPADYFSWATALWGSSVVNLSATDREFAAEIIQLGLYPGRAIQWQNLTERRQLMLTAAARKAVRALSAEADSNTTVHNGWHYPEDHWYVADGHTVSVAQSDNYELRAKMALRSPGHLPLDEVVSLSAGDQALGGDALNGSEGRQYELRFDANNLPPAQGFWSLAIHATAGGAVDNVIGRSRLGSDSPLTRDSDGSVSIYLSNENPHGEHSSDILNWLPIPASNFRVELQIFWPGRQIGGEDGWLMPAIKQRRQTK